MERTNDPERSGPGAAPAGAGVPPPPELERSHPVVPGEGVAAARGVLGDAAGLIQNRVILFGLGALVVLLLLTIVLVVVGGGGDDNTPSVVVPTTPGEDATAMRPLVGLPGRLLSDATVRNGPGLTYNYIGLIPEARMVPVVGRNEDGTWLQVLYPVNSQVRGWVIASQIDVDGDIATLVLAGPGAGPQVPLPTSFPFLTPEFPGDETTISPEEPTATEERPTRPTRTPVPSATRIFVATSTPVPPQLTPAGQ